MFVTAQQLEQQMPDATRLLIDCYGVKYPNKNKFFPVCNDGA
jgi:hypothetical protein